MQIRMGKRLDFSLDLPPELAQVQVPALILQSLVENAIVHGLEPKVEGGRITIRAAHDAQYLVLRVSDDGLGFDSVQSKEGFGLTQVRERLQSRYGEDATIELIAISADSMPATGSKPLEDNATGCQITLRLPMQA
jgi:sensor histidine kinase YesM